MTQRYSYSAIQTFAACPLKYFYKHEVGLRLRTEGISQHHLVWGKAMHSALEALYRIQHIGDDGKCNGIASFTGGPSSSVDVAKSIFAAGYPVQLDPTDNAKTQENGLRVLDLYARRWVEEDKRWKVLDVELLDCDLLDEDDDESGYYSRRLDMVVEDLQFGGVYGVDHKTVGGKNRYLKGGYWDSFDPNSQITQYIDWIKQKYGRCDGFYINAIGLRWTDELDARGYFNGSSFEPDDPTQPWLDFSHYELRKPKNSKTEKMRAWGLQVEFRREMFSRNEVQIQQEQKSTRYWIKEIEEARGRCICGHWKDEHRNTTETFCQAEVVSEELQDAPCSCEAFEQSWGFDTASCTYCEFKGNDATPGPCKAGWSWPTDQALIELSYRRECRQVIMLACPECEGRGVALVALDWMLKTIYASAGPGELLEVAVPPCAGCKGSGKVQGPRCVLDLNHAGECSNTPPVVTVSGGGEFEVEVVI